MIFLHIFGLALQLVIKALHSYEWSPLPVSKNSAQNLASEHFRVFCLQKFILQSKLLPQVAKFAEAQGIISIIGSLHLSLQANKNLQAGSCVCSCIHTSGTLKTIQNLQKVTSLFY